jgi:hypothetical protein
LTVSRHAKNESFRKEREKKAAQSIAKIIGVREKPNTQEVGK